MNVPPSPHIKIKFETQLNSLIVHALTPSKQINRGLGGSLEKYDVVKSLKSSDRRRGLRLRVSVVGDSGQYGM